MHNRVCYTPLQYGASGFKCFNNVACMEYVFLYSIPLPYLPLRACSHIPPTTGSRPLPPLHGRPVPPELSNVSAPESATPATPSSSAANCSAAGLFEKREPATEPQTQQNTVTKYHFVCVRCSTLSITQLKLGCKY